MARPLRLEYPGAFYHVTSRGNEKKAIFMSNRDRGKFLSYLESASNRYGAVVHAYCLIDNHYHLLLETPRGNLSQILHHINGAYTAYFNTRMKRSGHLFQGRYKGLLVEKDPYSQELSRYIHLNPVRARLVERPSAYRWSSYRSYVGQEEKPLWLRTESILGYFGEKKSSAQRNYQKFVEGTIEDSTEDPFREVYASTVLGSSEFVEWVKRKLIPPGISDSRNVPALRQLVEKPSLERIEGIVESVMGRGDSFFKKFCICVSHQYGGFSLKEIGRYYGMRDSAVSQSSRRFKEKVLENKRLTRLMTEIVRNIGSVES